MTKAETSRLVERVLALATADHTEVTISASDESSTRYANNSITQNVAKANQQVSVRAAFGRQVGEAQTNRLDDEGLASVVRRAEGIARTAAPNTEYLPPPARCEYLAVHACDPATADVSPAGRAAAVRTAIDRVERDGLTAAGSFATEFGQYAIGNSAGLFAYHEATQARFLCTAVGPTSSGWAESSSHALSEIDAAAAADRAAGKATAGANPTTPEPGPCVAILEPAAVAELFAFMAWSMDAKAADEGRSAFSGKMGEAVGVPDLRIYSKPDHPHCPAAPFGEAGLPAGEVDWISAGKIANLATSRFWAEKSGRPFTGRPGNLLIDGRSDTTEAMIAATERGVLITRFWYIRFVDPMKLLLTGMTRDGLFEIRDGKVVGGLKNMRFNESPLRLLQRITHMGAPQHIGGYFDAYVPPIRVSEFAFTSGTGF